MSALPHPVARTPEEWGVWLRAAGEPGFRAGQVFRWIHGRGVLEPEEMSDLPKGLRAALALEGVAAPLALEQLSRSSDGSRKLLVRMTDGATVETVLLPANAPGARDDADAAASDDDEEAPSAQIRVTQCISTQVGCAMGCVFCASGIAGLKRHMSAAEIVAQVLIARSQLEPNEALRGVVFMGMGEPLHNYDEVKRAIELLAHEDGTALAPRRLTVSTSGLVPEIARLGADFGGQVSLAISLHQADDEKRSALMPVNKKYPLAELIAVLRAYPLPPRRHITIEYTLVRGQNDAPEDADGLARLLRGLRVKVNLIPMNPIEHSALGPPDMGHVTAFQERLVAAGYLCFVRRRRGDDVAAACGQLALKGAAPNARFLSRQPSRRP